MSKHTPGPWSYIALDEWSHRVVTSHGTLPDGTPSYWTVADINKRREPEHEANARLIAAAPELLEALQDLTLNVGEAMKTGGWVPTPLHASFWEAMSNGFAAIAKATGEKQ